VVFLLCWFVLLKISINIIYDFHKLFLKSTALLNSCISSVLFIFLKIIKFGLCRLKVFLKLSVTNKTWEPNICSYIYWQVQGSIAVASLVEVLLGLTGTVTLLIRFIGPLTITATVSLIGLDLLHVAPLHAQSHWGIAMLWVKITASWINSLSCCRLWLSSKYSHNNKKSFIRCFKPPIAD